MQLQDVPGWECSPAALLSGMSDLFNAPATWGVVLVHPIFLVCLFYVVCVCVLTQLCLTLCNPMDCSLPDSSVHGIFQARILEWVTISHSRRSCQPTDQTCISCVFCISRQIVYHCAT